MLCIQFFLILLIQFKKYNVILTRNYYTKLHTKHFVAVRLLVQSYLAKGLSLYRTILALYPYTKLVPSQGRIEDAIVLSSEMLHVNV